MNYFQKLRYKTRVVALLALLLVCLLLGNFLNQSNMTNVEKAATTIYEDRLLPSTYLFDIREFLFKERTSTFPINYQKEIKNIIEKYEKTVLTQQEAKVLEALETNLAAYYNSANGTEKKNESFEKIREDLNQLMDIQTNEAKHIKTDLVATLKASTWLAYLEASLLIIIGGIALSLIGFSRNIFTQTFPQNPSLN
jgi:hypothetical protein